MNCHPEHTEEPVLILSKESLTISAASRFEADIIRIIDFWR